MRPPAAANDGVRRQLGLGARDATRTCRFREAQVLPLVPLDGQLHVGHSRASRAQFYCARPGRAARAVRPPPVFPGRAVVGRLARFSFCDSATVGGGRAGNEFSSLEGSSTSGDAVVAFLLSTLLLWQDYVAGVRIYETTKRVSLTSADSFVGGASRADGVPLKIINFGPCSRAKSAPAETVPDSLALDAIPH